MRKGKKVNLDAKYDDHSSKTKVKDFFFRLKNTLSKISQANKSEYYVIPLI